MRSAAAVASHMLRAETTLIIVTHVFTALLGAIAVRSSFYVMLASVLLLALVYQRYTDSIAPIVTTQVLCIAYMAFALTSICKAQRVRRGRRALPHDSSDDTDSYSSESASDSETDDVVLAALLE